MSDIEQTILAVRTGQLSTVKRLQARGELDRNLRDPFGATCLHFAARSGSLDLVKFLVEVAGHSTILTAQNGALASHDAAAAGHQGCLEYLLGRGCQEDARDHNGATVLHLSARFGHLRLLRYLVEVRGMSIRDKDGQGVSILHYAASKGDLACLMYIIATVSAMANDRTESGATPAYFAVQNGHLACLQHLVKAAGANVHLRANDGMQPIHAAAQTGKLHCVIWLVHEQGVLVMERDNDGATPLHFAASRGHAGVVRWLLDNGAACERDNLGGTPLHDAAEHGQLECAKILVEHGCDVNSEDKDFLVASDLAKKCNHAKVTRFLRSIEKRSGNYKVKDKSKGDQHIPTDQEAGVYIKQSFSSSTNTSSSSVSVSSITSDLETSSSAGTIGEEFAKQSGQYEVTDSPTPHPTYLQIYEKLTELEPTSRANGFLRSSRTVNSVKDDRSSEPAGEENHGPKKISESCSQGTQTDRENVEMNRTRNYDQKALLTPSIISSKKYLSRQRATEESDSHSEDTELLLLPKLSPEKKELRFSTTVMVEEIVQSEDGAASPMQRYVQLIPLNRSSETRVQSPPLRKQFLLDVNPSPPPLTNSPPPHLQTVIPNRPATPIVVPPPPPKVSPSVTKSHPYQNGLHQLNDIPSRLSFITSNVPPTTPSPPPPPPTPPPPNPSLLPNGLPRRSPTTSLSPSVSPHHLPGPPTPSDLANVVLRPSPVISRRSQSTCSPTNSGVNNDLIAEIKARMALRQARPNQSMFLGVNQDPPSESSSPTHDKGPKVHYAVDFLDSIPLTDENGAELPDWKRRFLAKKEAEKANKQAVVDYKLHTQRKAEERKYRDMPAWRVELLKKKEASQRPQPNSADK